MAVTKNNYSSFGVMLKTLRKRRHFTQQQLAEVIGVHRSTLVNWEQGDFLPGSKAMVLELARHLKLDDQETFQLLEASLTALTPRWSVPYPRNPYFTGREEVLEALHAQLGIDRAVALTQSSALHGLGGVGKTQIALEYAYQHAMEYSAIFWLGAETEEQIVSSFLRVAEVLQLPEREEKDQQRVVAAVQHWLSTHRQWLVIWDNVEDLALLDRFLPSARSGTFLITTRCRAFGTLAQGLDLLPMEQEEGILFLLRRAKVLTLEEASEQVHQPDASMLAQYSAAIELVEVVGGLPLALDQAGAYLETTQCGLPAYIDLFHTHRAALLALRGEGVRDHPASVTTTFTLALRAIAEHHPATLDLLRVCSLLQPDAIPEELFRQGVEHLGMQLQAVCRDPLEWNKIVGVASSYSLLSRQPGQQTLSIHRLVQAVLVEGMTKTEQEQWHQCIIQSLDAMFPDVGPLTASAARQQGRRLLPHASLLLRQATGASASLSLASLAYKTAQYLREGSQYTDAQPLFWLALQLYEQLPGSDSCEVAKVCNYLGVLYAQQGQYSEAQPLLVRALHIYELLAPDHPDLARSLDNLALLLTAQAQYAEAIVLLQRSLRVRELAPGPGHQKLAQTLHNLGDLYARQEQYAEAKPYLERALHLLEQSPDQPPMVLTLITLGEAYCQLGQYAEAQRCLGRAWHLGRKLLGSEHPTNAHALASLGRLAFFQGNVERANRLCRRAFHIWESHLEHEPLDLVELLTTRADISQELREDVEAASFYQQALSLLEACQSSTHPKTVRLQRALELLRERQERQETEPSLLQCAPAWPEDMLAHTGTLQASSAHPMQEAGRVEIETILEHRSEAILELHGNEHHKGNALSFLHDAAPPMTPSSNDPLQAFLNAHCELHSRAWCRSAELWQAYQQWVEQHQERYPLSRGAFIAQLKTHGFRAERTMSARIWRGITLVKKEA